MHISCVICSDLFVAADDTFGTQCGHLFHYQCLIQWIERSQSCPQCRNKTSEESIHRIYFNIPNTTENTEDPSILYNKIDSLNFQIRLKDTDIKNITEENVKLKGHNLALRELQTETDEKRNQARSEIYKLKSELKALKESKQVRSRRKVPIPEHWIRLYLSNPHGNQSTDTVEVLLCLPNGVDMQRRFKASAPLKVLLDDLVVLGFPPDEYKVLSNWPRRDLTSLDAKKTLQELNLRPQETVYLEEW